MKRYLSVILCISLLLSLFGCRKEKIEIDTRPKTIPESTLPFSVGINTNGLEGYYGFNSAVRYLSEPFTYENIKSKGFDHIRLPVNFHRLYSKKDNALKESTMKKIDKILDLVEKAELYVIIDFHGWWDMDFSNVEHQEEFLNIWELLANRYKDRSDYVIFELLNEPQTTDVVTLNNWQNWAIYRIRKTNPNRLIICATPDGNQPWLLEKFYMPVDDKNLVVAVHLYNPPEFTHQGFEWAKQPKNKQVRLTDTHLSTLRWDLEQIEAFIKRTGLPVIINEFGMNLKLADKKDRDKFLRTITQFCVDNGIPWTYWQYNDNGGMGLYRNKKWDIEAIDSLFLR